MKTPLARRRMKFPRSRWTPLCSVQIEYPVDDGRQPDMPPYIVSNWQVARHEAARTLHGLPSLPSWLPRQEAENLSGQMKGFRGIESQSAEKITVTIATSHESQIGVVLTGT